MNTNQAQNWKSGREKPTKEGWYWYKSGGDIHPVRWKIFPKGCFGENGMWWSNEQSRGLCAPDCWSGPIEPPKFDIVPLGENATLF